MYLNNRAHKWRPLMQVTQILTNASVLVQSIENPDSSGSRTAHFSLDNLSASISEAWTENNSGGACQQVLFPTSIDLRAVYQTIEEGCPVRQDFSFDCDSIKCRMVRWFLSDA